MDITIIDPKFILTNLKEAVTINSYFSECVLSRPEEHTNRFTVLRLTSILTYEKY